MRLLLCSMLVLLPNYSFTLRSRSLPFFLAENYSSLCSVLLRLSAYASPYAKFGFLLARVERVCGIAFLPCLHKPNGITSALRSLALSWIIGGSTVYIRLILLSQNNHSFQRIHRNEFRYRSLLPKSAKKNRVFYSRTI